MDARKTLLDKLRSAGRAGRRPFAGRHAGRVFRRQRTGGLHRAQPWGYGRPTLREIHAHFQAIARRPDVQGVYVGLHQDWGMALECDDWPAAENIHVISSATQADAERWLEGLEADGLITGWPYGKHAAGPEAGRVPGLYGVLGLILPARGPAATPVWRPGPACTCLSAEFRPRHPGIVRASGATSSPASSRSRTSKALG